MTADPRLEKPHWRPEDALPWAGRRRRWLVLCNVPLAIWYLRWLLVPGRVANPVLYALLLAAEGLNIVQAVGFWWTLASIRRRRPRPPCTDRVAVDVFIPVYGEPVEIVEATVVAATRLRGDPRVALLDDGCSADMEALAARHGVRYLCRPGNEGAKAGNINWALDRTDAPFVAILDCDHVPDPRFLEVTLAHFDERVAFVQTPQYYANGRDPGVAAASWAQQALFFGTIAVGRDELGAMFCCGTNVVFRREALEDAGGFPTASLTEDFDLSIRLHERGWESRYVPEVLAAGLGPEDMASYTGQQLRWARGCLSSLPRILRARLPLRIRLNYLLSAVYWLTGWTYLIYMTFPVVRILTGAQPIVVASPDEFLLHWAPYFAGSMATVTLAAGGCYTFAAFALAAANFWVHIVASVLTLLRRKGSFVVTPKKGTGGRQLRPVAVPLFACAVLIGVSAWGLAHDRSPATLNNVAFASVHVFVLLAGSWAALHPPRRRAPSDTPAEVPVG
ncbi:MAG TPA: cellulose synthase catalytic subunit [Acidimicrobiales bacterium]|nr:cellulose synthase catalytic subunit [Acidimicrobiales bacterium]